MYICTLKRLLISKDSTHRPRPITIRANTTVSLTPILLRLLLTGTCLGEDCFCGATAVVDYFLAHGEGRGLVRLGLIWFGGFRDSSPGAFEGGEEVGRLA